MPASSDITWAALQDIELVASCMPGAAITERIDDRHYKGTVALKVGPASLKFRGEIEVRELDAATRTLRLFAKGTDTSGSSAATMDLSARVEAAECGLSQLVGHSEATVSGKVAAFASRMMDAVADQILKQFAANFAAKVSAGQSAMAPSGTAKTAPPGGDAAATATAPAPTSVNDMGATAPTSGYDAGGAVAAPRTTAAAPGTAATGTPAAPASTTAGAAAPQPELNGLTLLWGVLRDWLRGLFSKKSA